MPIVICVSASGGLPLCAYPPFACISKRNNMPSLGGQILAGHEVLGLWRNGCSPFQGRCADQTLYSFVLLPVRLTSNREKEKESILHVAYIAQYPIIDSPMLLVCPIVTLKKPRKPH
jgi:hypothetical protein